MTKDLSTSFGATTGNTVQLQHNECTHTKMPCSPTDLHTFPTPHPQLQLSLTGHKSHPDGLMVDLWWEQERSIPLPVLVSWLSPLSWEVPQYLKLTRLSRDHTLIHSHQPLIFFFPGSYPTSPTFSNCHSFFLLFVFVANNPRLSSWSQKVLLDKGLRHAVFTHVAV